MKASELIERLRDILLNHGDFQVSVMQELKTKAQVGDLVQIQSDVTDVAVANRKQEIIVIGQELL